MGTISSEKNETVTEITIRHKPHVSNNSGNNEWYTPPKLIEAARLVMGDIDLDPASSEVANVVVAARKIYTINDNGLEKPWSGRIWLNPPYGQPWLKLFAKTFSEKYQSGEFQEGCVLVNNGTETEWFSILAKQSAAMCFLRGRLKFFTPEGTAKGTPLQGQIVLYFGKNADRFKSVFSEMGLCVQTS